MYMETMQQIYSNTTKVFVDSKNGNNVLYLPLDKLVEQNRQRLAEAAAAAPGASERWRKRAGSGERGGTVGRVRRGGRVGRGRPVPRPPRQRRQPASRRAALRCVHATPSAIACVKTTCNKEREHESRSLRSSWPSSSCCSSASSMVFVVDERPCRRRLSRMAKASALLGPGLHFKLPPPLPNAHAGR